MSSTEKRKEASFTQKDRVVIHDIFFRLLLQRYTRGTSLGCGVFFFPIQWWKCTGCCNKTCEMKGFCLTLQSSMIIIVSLRGKITCVNSDDECGEEGSSKKVILLPAEQRDKLLKVSLLTRTEQVNEQATPNILTVLEFFCLF